MKLKRNLVAGAALGAAVLCGAGLAGVTPAQAADKPAHTVSREVGKPLKAAQEALQKGDYSTALAKLQEADGMPKKSPYEQHLIHEMQGYAYVRTKQYPQAAKALESELNDGFLTPDETRQHTVAVAQLNYQIKNYDKAIQYGTEAIDKGWADAQMPTLVAQAYYLKNDWKGVVRFEKSQIDAAQKKGLTPANESLQLLLSACLKMNNEDCTDDALQQLVVLGRGALLLFRRDLRLLEALHALPVVLQVVGLADEGGHLRIGITLVDRLRAELDRVVVVLDLVVELREGDGALGDLRGLEEPVGQAGLERLGGLRVLLRAHVRIAFHLVDEMLLVRALLRHPVRFLQLRQRAGVVALLQIVLCRLEGLADLAADGMGGIFGSGQGRRGPGEARAKRHGGADGHRCNQVTFELHDIVSHG